MLGFLIVLGVIGVQIVATIPQGYASYNNFNTASVSNNPQILTETSQFSNSPIGYYHKQFFIHTAPDETIEEAGLKSKNSDRLTKNLRLLFIKTPFNNGFTQAAEQLAKQKTSEHTIIYVLNKHIDTSELRNKLEELNEINPNKPEVHFVRYKTKEDAENAQNSIQTQYDNLGQGSLEIVREGVPDIISYVGTVDSNQQQNLYQQNREIQQVQEIQQNQQIEFNNEQSFESTGISLGNAANIPHTYIPALYY